jgi:hypothetical protein
VDLWPLSSSRWCRSIVALRGATVGRATASGVGGRLHHDTLFGFYW